MFVQVTACFLFFFLFICHFKSIKWWIQVLWVQVLHGSRVSFYLQARKTEATFDNNSSLFSCWIQTLRAHMLNGCHYDPVILLHLSIATSLMNTPDVIDLCIKLNIALCHHSHSLRCPCKLWHFHFFRFFKISLWVLSLKCISMGSVGASEEHMNPACVQMLWMIKHLLARHES